MRKVLAVVLTAALLAAAVFLPERLAALSDGRTFDRLQIQQEDRESFSESVQLTVAEKLLLLRSGDMEALALNDDPVQATGIRFSVTGGEVSVVEETGAEAGTFDSSRRALYVLSGDGEELMLVEEGSGEIADGEALEEACDKWSDRVRSAQRELWALQSAGALPSLWTASDTAECGGFREYVVIDPATQVSFGMYRMSLDADPFSVSLWADAQTGRVLSLSLIWSGDLSWGPSRGGGNVFGGAWRSYWSMDGVDGSWYPAVRDIMETTASLTARNGDFSAVCGVAFTYNDTRYPVTLECIARGNGESVLTWNGGLM